MKIKYRLIVFDIFLIILLCCFMHIREKKHILNVSLISNKEKEELYQTRTKETLEYDLFFCGEKVPWYASEIEQGYMISQSEGSDWQGSISTNDKYQIAFLEDNGWKEKDAVIQEMRSLPFVVYDENYYCEGTILVTSLPIMTLNTQYTETDDKERFYGRLQFFEVDKGYGPKVQAADCEYHVRGLSSRGHYKTGFKISLFNETGGEKKISLAGMREDDDWILRAMGLDESKIREKLSLDLWNQMNSYGTYHSEYMELFLNGEYWGLYLLQEPMDFKTLSSAPDNTFLIQTKIWSNQADFWEDYEKKEYAALRCGEFEIDKRNIENIEEIYAVLEEYKCMQTDKSAGKVKLQYNKEQLYMLDVFLQTIVGMDNVEKNQFLAINKIGTDVYELIKLPWDLDLTFGLYFDSYVYEDFYAANVIDYTMQNLLATVPEETQAKRKETYWNLRTSILTEENLLQQIDALYGTLDASSCLKRENEAWDQNAGREHVEFITTFVQKRLQWMDSYYVQL